MVFLKSLLFYCSVVTLFLFLLLLYILGGVRYITDFEENTCEMTYMFEYPQYVVCIFNQNTLFYKELIYHSLFIYFNTENCF